MKTSHELFLLVERQSITSFDLSRFQDFHKPSHSKIYNHRVVGLNASGVRTTHKSAKTFKLLNFKNFNKKTALTITLFVQLQLNNIAISIGCQDAIILFLVNYTVPKTFEQFTRKISLFEFHWSVCKGEIHQGYPTRKIGKTFRMQFSAFLYRFMVF